MDSFCASKWNNQKMQLNTRMLFLLTLAVGVVLHITAFLHELSFERFFRDTVSLYTGALIVAFMSVMGAMKKKQIGAITGTVVGLVLWGFLHRLISVYETDFSPFIGVQILFLILISATVNRLLFWDMSRDDSEQRQIDPEGVRRLHSAKQSLQCKLHPRNDHVFISDTDSLAIIRNAQNHALNTKPR